MAARPDRVERPAFYALQPGGWRDVVTLLHPPKTAWNLSYVALAAAVAPGLHLDRLPPAAPALHRLAPELRGARRRRRAGAPPRPARRGARGVLPRRRRRRSRARR